MPTGLELLAAQYAPKQRQLKKPLPTDIAEVAAQPEGDAGELLPRNRGAAMSALNWIGRFGQVGKNLVGSALGTAGSLEGAARQTADILGDAVDAVLPGDWIPEFSRPQDEVTGADVEGISKEWQKEHPLLALGASLPADVLLDPITYTGFGLIGKAAVGVGKAAEAAALASKIPRAAEAVQAVKDVAAAGGRGLRSVMGDQRLAAPVSDAADLSNAAKAGVAEVGGKQVQELFRGYTKQELEVAGDVADNLLHDAAGRPVGKIVSTPASSLAERIAAHPGAAGMDAARIEQVIRDSQAFMARQGMEAGLGAPVSSVSDMLAEGGRQVGGKGDYPIFTPGPGVEDYLPRMYKGKSEKDALAELIGDTASSGSAKPLNERTLLTPDQVIEHFGANPGLTNVRNLGERVANRVSQQAELARRATFGQGLVDAVKSGKIKLSDKALEGLAGDVPAPKAARLGENTAADIAPATAAPGDTLFKAGLAGQSGELANVLKTPGTPGLDMLGGAGPKIAPDIYGIGEQSGKAIAAGDKTIPRQSLDPLASLAGESKPITDLSRTLDHVMNHEFRLADPVSKRIANAAIQSLDPESAKYANGMFNGLAPRGPAMQALAKMNQVIKPMMVYGYVIPKIGTDIRNAVSGVWQAFSNPNTRGTALSMAGRLPSTIADSVTRALGLKVDTGSLGKVLDVAEQAMKDSGGVYSKALQLMEAHPGVAGFTGPQIAAVYRSGAPGGFVTMEGMMNTMAGTPWKAKYQNWTEFPARIFKGIEDRMRVGMGLDLLKAGKSEADIGKFVNSALYSYDVSSVGNRAIRDVLPFQAFTNKAIPQQLKLFNEKPWLAVGMASLLTEKQGQPIYPYQEGKLNIPLGANDQGQPQYISGTGLPFEALSQIPNLSGSPQESGRDLERILGGSSQPVLKSLFGLVSGEDPYFESPYGTYSKLPGNIEGGAAGRAYNILNGLGVLQPIDAPLRLVGKLADTRQSAGVKALDNLTGANIVSVDENKALQQRLTDYLRHNPDVDSYQALYSRSGDPKVKALLQQLGDAKKRIKAKKKADTLTGLAP